jgi:hypothetical protein
MSTKESGVSGPTALFTRRNVLLLAVALATIGAGYAVLVSDPAGGSASAAAVLLVLGYCILFPLALLA